MGLKDRESREQDQEPDATERSILFRVRNSPSSVRDQGIRHSHRAGFNVDMDDLRDSFSSLKKGIKNRLTGNKRKTDKPRADGIGESSGPSGPLPRPGPPAVTSDDREREGNEPNPDDESVEPGAAPDVNRSDWKSTASASAKLILRGVRDSSDAFCPLKAVASGLCFILENCEVRSSSPNATHDAHQCRSVRGKTNKR